MGRNIGIHGMVMRPCSLTLEDNKATISSSEYYVEKDFLSSYNHNLAINQIVAESAKIYIVENWEKVDDWSGMHIRIKDGRGIVTEYYKHDDEKYKEDSSLMGDTFIKISKERHNPIDSFSDVILDTTDGDFSVKINNTDHIWIDDESVIIIADYIEESLNNGKNLQK